MRGILVSAILIASALLGAACNTSAPTDEEIEAAAWGYRGRPSNLFLSEHGLGSREESISYYAAVLNGSGVSSFTLEKWKSQFIGAAPVYTALYKNKLELGFWREMTCTQLIARGVGGCFVTNWQAPDEPGTGVPNQGTVAMNVSSEGFARFYVFLPDGKLSPSAVLDQEGPKFLPRLCTVCHSGANPKPSESADLGSVFREFEPELLQSRPGISRVTAEQEWFHLNRVVQQANHAIRPEADGSPFGTDHAKRAINDRIDALYIPGGEPDGVPESWAQAGSEAKTLWSKVMVPYCLACHRHNLYDWTEYSNFEYFRKETSPGVYPIKNYLPDAPDPDEPVGAMPQAALSFDLLKRDIVAKNAISAWLGERPGAPQPGTFCSTPNEVFERDCGVCGKQEAVCLPAAGGVNRVSAYSTCRGEVPNGCDPGSVESVACGRCGTQTRTCNNQCTFAVSACTGEPPNACTVGDVDLTTAGCTPGLFRTRTCESGCSWGSFAATCVASLDTPIVVPTTIGQIAARVVTLDSARTTARPATSSACPIALSTAITPFAYVEVKNPTNKTATVTVFNSRIGASGPIIDTLLVAYGGRTIPTTEAQRRACLVGVGDFGEEALTGDPDFASLSGDKAVTIPPNGSVQIYVGAYPPFDSSNPVDSTGNIKLTVRTDRLQ